MTTKVLYFVNDATETSISLEIASQISESDLAIEVVSFFKPDDNTFSLDIETVGANSQVSPKHYRMLYKKIKEKDPDIIHIHPHGTGSIVRIIAKLIGIPHIISTEHNPHTHFSKLKNTINGSTNWLSDIVISNSKTTADSFSKWERVLLQLGGSNFRVIYNGVDITAIDKAIRYRDPPSLPDGYLVGFAARLVPQKNLVTAIDAMAELVSTRSDVHLVIVGRGPQQQMLKSKARTHDILNHVHFLGYLPKRRDVYPFFDKLDVFLFPSIFEGFGVAMAEAMAARTPVVVNDIQTTREIAGDAGVYIDPSDPNEFASAISDLLSDNKKRNMLAEIGRKRVESQFCLESTVEQHINLYKDLVISSDKYTKGA